MKGLSGHSGFDEEDSLHEECGVFGVFGHPGAGALTVLGLHALQHRGQEAAGIGDRSELARAAIRWILAQRIATVLVVGVATPQQLQHSLEAANQPDLTEEDRALLDRLRGCAGFAAEQAGQYEFFVRGFI